MSNDLQLVFRRSNLDRIFRIDRESPSALASV
jgi:hypothetical protein